jgi:hypothetical protein
MSRRRVIAGLGVAGAAAGLGVTPSEAEAAAASVRGTWLIKPTTGGGPAGFQALAAFAAGGVFVTTGSDEAGTGLGEWSARGAHGFGFTYVNFHFDTAGEHSNTVKVRARGSFHDSHLSGHATLRTFDASGKQVGAARKFKFNGRRVRVEAP